MSNAHKKMKSPVGQLTLVASDKGLAAILWEDDDPLRVRIDVGREDSHHLLLLQTESQLNEYFNGTRKEFSLPLDLVGTPFQRLVWQALLGIPFGETQSYGQLARQIGHPKSARAVGGANAKNPVSIVAPCHRVVGTTGVLAGFAGGLAAKEFLLRLEGRSITGELSGTTKTRRAGDRRHPLAYHPQNCTALVTRPSATISEET